MLYTVYRILSCLVKLSTLHSRMPTDTVSLHNESKLNKRFYVNLGLYQDSMSKHGLVYLLSTTNNISTNTNKSINKCHDKLTFNWVFAVGALLELLLLGQVGVWRIAADARCSLPFVVATAFDSQLYRWRVANLEFDGGRRLRAGVITVPAELSKL